MVVSPELRFESTEDRRFSESGLQVQKHEVFFVTLRFAQEG